MRVKVKERERERESKVCVPSDTPNPPGHDATRKTHPFLIKVEPPQPQQTYTRFNASSSNGQPTPPGAVVSLTNHVQPTIENTLEAGHDM